MKNVNLILAALLVFGAASARADEVVILERTASDFDTWGATSAGRARALNAISGETGLPVTTLEAQRDRTRLGYGGLFIANSLASATGKTFDEIVALKASGHGWGWIARQNNVKLGPIISGAHRADASFKHGNGKLKKAKRDKGDKFDGHADGFRHGNGLGRGKAKGDGKVKGHGGGHGKGH
ncbi:MAG: hypothetical protein QOE73_2478 [Verrucomicrobiota bacterium]